MSRDWKDFFETWASPPSQTELDEASQTEKQIRSALDAWPATAKRNFRVFVKGSNKSGTNVRRGSDIDLAVELLGASIQSAPSFVTQKTRSAAGLADAQLGLVDAPAEYAIARKTFKDDCVDAMVSAFGPANVQRHNKCIAIAEKSTTLPADVVPCTTRRRYDASDVFHDGILIQPDNGSSIINWPVQDYENGVSKNTATSRRYKRTVRGLKALNNRMHESGTPRAPSWLIECLTYNAPAACFDSPTNVVNVLSVLNWLLSELGSTVGAGEWVEVNGLKYLFAPGQPWSVTDATAFTRNAIIELTR